MTDATVEKINFFALMLEAPVEGIDNTLRWMSQLEDEEATGDYRAAITRAQTDLPRIRRLLLNIAADLHKSSPKEQA